MTTLLFIHGSGATGEVFAEQLRAFPGSLAPSLPAAGSSVADLADFIESRIPPEGAILAGSSLGGAIALEIALRHNPKVRGVVLLGSGSRLKVAPAILEGLQHDFEATAVQIAGYMFADPTRERINASVALMQRVGQGQTLRDFAACNSFDVTARLGEIRVPLLAITGEQDVMTPPKYATTLAGRVAGAQVRIIPGAGHLVMIERPAETNDAIGNFVQEVG
jgi:pimeloyl-ACP methyl ester carboxylesterase